jgi:selenocysteine lyase/cysteine desulfurase
VQLYDRREVRVVQLNNAATTPPFQYTLEVLNEFLRSYGALHRGAGPRARKTVAAVDKAIAEIRAFLHCPDSHALLFTQNTSAAINLLARMRNLESGDAVAISEVEHTSNALPWRCNTKAAVLTIKADATGILDLDDLQRIAFEYRKRLKLVAVTGASNLTGCVTDVGRVSDIAHSVGAQVFVDAAQMAPHRPIDMQGDRIDMLAFSAHKLYAPFGLGVLAIPRRMLETLPVDPGGGSIQMLSEWEVGWAPPDERHQTGTWNAVGIVALGASCEEIGRTGWGIIRQHERQLVEYTAARLSAIEGLTMHVPARLYAEQDRIGTYPFSLNGYHYALLTSILEHEYGMELRAGTICNHRLVRRWFDLSDPQQRAVEERMKAGDRLASYGIARASLGIHNTTDDIDRLVDALIALKASGPRLHYRPWPEKEAYEPEPPPTVS